jgi:hypothetical protein
MIKEIRLSNFQGFSELTRIPLAPITLIFGPNSSGKSSIIKSLLFVKQSFSQTYFGEGRMAFVGANADLGGFEMAVHKHDSSKRIQIGVTGAFDDLDFRAAKSEIPSGREYSFDLNVGKDGEIELASFGVTNFEGLQLGPSRKMQFIRNEDGSNTFKLWKANLSALREVYEGLFVENDLPKNSDGSNISFSTWKKVWVESSFHPSPLAMRQGQDLLGKMHDEFPFSIGLRKGSFPLGNPWSITLGNMLHIAGIRFVPERFTSLGNSDRQMSNDASNIERFLSNRPEHVKRISRWLNHISGGAYEVHLVKHTTPGLQVEIGSLVLRDCFSNTDTSFRDAGIGLSQVLPIIALLTMNDNKSKSFRFRSSGTLLLEQPELHLHPRMQSLLAEFLIEHSKATNPRRQQLIIETHSENLILAIQKNVRLGKLRPEDVSILYISKQRKTGVSKVKVLPLASNGDFLAAWPESFSDIRLQEMLA